MPIYTDFASMSAVPETLATKRLTKRDIYQGGPHILCRSYQRASRDPNGTLTSITAQRRHNQERADEYGWTLVGGDYTDNDKSGGRRAKPGSREQWERLLSDIHSDPGHLLVLFEMARGTRDLKVYVDLRDLCTENGPYFWFVGDQLYDVRLPHDRQALNALATKAEGGGDDIGYAISSGIKQAVEDGRPHGQAPFGYCRTYRASDHRMDEQFPDEKRRPGGWSPAGVVRQLFADYVAGVPMAHIVKDLNDRGVHTPRHVGALRSEDEDRIKESENAKWVRRTVLNILQNPHYLGIRMSQGVRSERPVIWGRLVSDELFFQAAARMKERGPKEVRPTSAQTLLTCLALCSCGGEMVHQKAREAYICRRGDSRVHALAADKFIEDIVAKFFADPKTAEWNTASQGNEAEEDQKRIDEIAAEIEGFEARANDPNNPFTWAMFDKYAVPLQKELNQLLAKKRDALPAVAQDMISDSVEAARKKWKDKLLPQQREILKVIFRVEVSPAGRGRRNVPIEDRITMTGLLF